MGADFAPSTWAAGDYAGVSVSFDWTQYLILGKELAGLAGYVASEEARLRCALSRTYYAAYNVALTLARRKGYVAPPDTGSHEALINHFQQHRNADWVQAGQTLQALKKLRVKADYYVVMPPADITVNNVRLQLGLTDALLADLRTLR